nr:uncharacterized protein LOC129422053 [Misgurnus anguillicaudatus]
MFSAVCSPCWSHPAAISGEFPKSPPPSFETLILPRPSNPSAPPWLLAPSSPPWPVFLLDPPGSLVPPTLAWSDLVPPPPQDSTPLASPRRSVPPALLGSSFPPAPPQSSVILAPLRLPDLASTSVARAVGSPLVLRHLGFPWAPSWLHPGHLLQNFRNHHSSPECRAAKIHPCSSCSSPPWLLPLSSPPWLH